MGLLGNNMRLNLGAQQSWCTVPANTQGDRNNFSVHTYRGIQDGNTTVLAQRAVPLGSYPEGTYYPPEEVGQMAFRPVGSGILSGGLFSDLLMTIDLTGSGTLNADLGLVVSMLCAMSGNGELSADIVGVINASANLTGSGGLSGDIRGVASMMIDMLGEGDLEATIAAYGNMSIDMVVTGTGLTTSNVGAAVWAALQTEIKNAGTAGAALLAAGSAGDPWSTILPASYTGTQAGAILNEIQTLVDELHQLQGAKLGEAMTVDTLNGTRSVGSIVLDLDTPSDGVTIVTRQ